MRAAATTWAGSSSFKADGAETANRYSISEVVGAEHDAYSERTPTPRTACSTSSRARTILVDDHWIDAAEGAFVLVPGGVTHDFQNRSAERRRRASPPRTFEERMPAIVGWFTDNPPSRAIA